MAEFTKIIGIRNRMCDKLNSCAKCPIYSDNTGTGCSCREFAFKYPKKFEDILLKWDAENPIKTNADKFKELFDVRGYKVLTDCDGFVCPDNQSCETCEFRNFWEKEYKENTNGRND